MNSEQLLIYLQEIIEDMLLEIGATDLFNTQKVDRLLGNIAELIDQFGYSIEDVIPEEIVNSYFNGAEQAEIELLRAREGFRPSVALDGTGQSVGTFNRRVHMEAVAQILDETLLDFKAAIRTAKASASNSIYDTLTNVKADLAKGIIKGDPRKVVQKKVAQSFAADGLTSFITKDGRRLPLDFYSMTVTRYKMREAANQGAVNRYTERKQDLVQVISNSDSCAECAKFRNLVISLNGYTEGFIVLGENGIYLPPYHPNCRCSISPFVIEVKTPEEIQAAQNRNAAYHPDKDPRTPAQKKAYDWEQTQRRKANAEKKQYARWVMTLGNEAPKTLGAFRRMKRQNTENYKKLAAAYRSTAAEND